MPMIGRALTFTSQHKQKLKAEIIYRSAPGAPGHYVLRREKELRPFPRTPLSASGILRRFAPMPDRFPFGMVIGFTRNH
jgi:hypothetical protein